MASLFSVDVVIGIPPARRVVSIRYRYFPGWPPGADLFEEPERVEILSGIDDAFSPADIAHAESEALLHWHQLKDGGK